jgi:hypothetical protein
VTNGNGNRQCDNLLATLPLFEIAFVLLRLDYVDSVPVLPLSYGYTDAASVSKFLHAAQDAMRKQMVELDKVK